MQTVQRSTARQGAAQRDADTPISKRVKSGLEGAAGADGDAGWFEPLDPDKVGWQWVGG